MGIIRCKQKSYIGISLIGLIFEYTGASPCGCTGVNDWGNDLGHGLKFVVLPLNALMLNDNLAEGRSMQTESGVKDIVYAYFTIILYF
jgi:hypothetical protein